MINLTKNSIIEITVEDRKKNETSINLDNLKKLPRWVNLAKLRRIKIHGLKLKLQKKAKTFFPPRKSKKDIFLFHCFANISFSFRIIFEMLRLLLRQYRVEN